MKKSLKSNGFLSIFIILFLIIFVSNPSLYMTSCLNGLTIWFYNILPALFPFFIATKLLISLDINSLPILDKIIKKCFRVNNGGKIFFLSLLSGYPVGAKLVRDAYFKGEIDLKSARKMLSFCSVSGPMFIIGSVGLAVYKSTKIGFILLLSHILSAIINGFVFRNSYKKDDNDIYYSNQNNLEEKKDNILGNSMLDSIISILLVGGYIVLAFVFIDLITDLKILDSITFIFSKIPFLNLPSEAISSLFKGLLEITRGIIDLKSTSLALNVKLIFTSFIIGFGGICVFLQSLTFTSHLKIKKPFYLFTKFCQGIWASIICAVICSFAL